LLLDFLSGSLDSRITFTRASTATFFNSSGVLTSASNDVARFDYNPATLAPLGLLIEESRTNLALNSGDALSGGAGGVVVANQITAPDGSLADFFQEDTSSAEHYSGDRSATVTAGTTYTWSFYAKLGLTGEARRVCVRTALQGAGSVVFDLETGSSTVIASVVSSGISSAGNGWWRCWIVYTPTGTGTALFRQQLSKGTNTVYTGDGTSGLFLWGAQLEAGAFPTSYIPTTTTALTRAADVASVNTLTPWYNAVEGTLYVEAVTSPGLSSFPTQLSISDGTANNKISTYLHTSGYYSNIRSGGSVQGDPGVLTAPTIGSVYKFAVGVETNNAISSANGTLGSADTTITMPVGVNQLRIGANETGGTYSNTWLRRITYYPRRLANAELQSLTL
jgi:hypothetical protein